MKNTFVTIAVLTAVLGFGGWLYGLVSERAEFKRLNGLFLQDLRAQNATIATLNRARDTDALILPQWRLENDENTAVRETRRAETKAAGSAEGFKAWADTTLPASLSPAGGLLGNRKGTSPTTSCNDAPGAADAGNTCAPVGGAK